MSIEQFPWGSAGAHRFTVRNGELEIVLSNYGATLLSVKFPDREGNVEELTLNFDHTTLQDHTAWAAANPKNYGTTVGRFANRIANAQFSLHGQNYQLAVNNGPNSLHDLGVQGDVPRELPCLRLVQLIEESSRGVGVEFQLRSPDGQEGYPGTLDASVSYIVSADNYMHIIYSGVADKATPCNLTNHAYWNLSGGLKRDVCGHHLRMPSRHYLPVDDTCIPTGEIKPVEGSAFDFRKGKLITDGLLRSVPGPCDDICGFDHCFVVEDMKGFGLDSLGFDEVGDSLKLVAVVSDNETGRQMTVLTDQPGVQLYTGNFLSKNPGEMPHCEHMALCLEAQQFPDAPNKPSFPSCILNPGEVYHHHTVHHFSRWFNTGCV